MKQFIELTWLHDNGEESKIHINSNLIQRMYIEKNYDNKTFTMIVFSKDDRIPVKESIENIYSLLSE